MNTTQRQLTHYEVKDKFSNLSSTPTLPIVLVVNDLRNPRNLGMLFRLADAAGIRQIFAVGALPENQDKIRRTACATQNYIQLQILEKPEDLLRLKPDFELVALEITENSIPYTNYRPQKGVALIIGNERNGIQAGVLEVVDQAIHIPMYGRGSSMNVAMAAGIAVYGLR